VGQLTMNLSRREDRSRGSHKAKRRHLKFADAGDVAAEVRLLRKGYQRAGNWSLEQICWHLNKALSYSMQPVESTAARVGLIRRLQLRIILATKRIPLRVRAPQRIMPSDETDASAIDEFLLTLQVLQAYDGQFAPHRLFGPISRDQFFRFHMIHCGHHLGYLIPARN